MDHERWLRIERLFHAASELPPERIQAFLHRETRPDAGLQAEVEALLQADTDAAARLGQIVNRACQSYFRSARSSVDAG